VLRAGRHAPPAAGQRPGLIIAGATGALGNEVLRWLVGSGRFATAQVLAREPITAGLRGVTSTDVPSDDPVEWPPTRAHVGVVLFDPPRMFYERERALWTPTPEQLPALAAWMRRSGVLTLAVVLPHEQGRLPEALKRGLANFDEHAVAALGFERLLILRSATKPKEIRHTNPFTRVAAFMLSVFKYMIPSSEQPARAAKIAQLLGHALELAPAGIHIAAPETVWQASQGDAREAALRWLC